LLVNVIVFQQIVANRSAVESISENFKKYLFTFVTYVSQIYMVQSHASPYLTSFCTRGPINKKSYDKLRI